ncbi:hypothetical protein cypCar_00010776, partial [Cyprinus carpio]
ALYCSDSISHTSVTISDFSDEILLNILRFIPSHDLMLNRNEVAVKQLLKNLSGDIQTLNLSGCYWLAGSTVDQVTRCKALVSLDLSACRLTSVRLSHLLTSLHSLRSLALDVGPGFDLHQLSAEGKSALARLQELKQTLLTPSYSVMPCCSALSRLHLYLEQHASLSEPALVLRMPGAWRSQSRSVGSVLGCFQYESPRGSYGTGTICARPRASKASCNDGANGEHGVDVGKHR